ncbi:UNVERIFIED_CONTAM: hypothetical protein Sradi_3569300 [Sesamum radiatum]|uniref:Uncharacterized protein n=1 Tax=Sesamum radiatum TaxID=300843 RepID=A0AAW2QG19_SESRA
MNLAVGSGGVGPLPKPPTLLSMVLPMDTKESLVFVLVNFVMGSRGLMLRRGRGRRRLARRGSIMRKRNRVEVVVESSEGMLHVAKRRHLVDEESDVLLAEATS